MVPAVRIWRTRELWNRPDNQSAGGDYPASPGTVAEICLGRKDNGTTAVLVLEHKSAWSGMPTSKGPGFA
jgi:hypothetical protein